MMTDAQEALLLCEFIREKAGVRIEEFCGTPHCCVRPTGFDELWQLDLNVAGAFSETPDRSVVFGSQTSVFLALVPDARDVVKSIMWTMNMVSVLVVLAKVLTILWSRARAYDKVLKPTTLTAVPMLGISSLALWLPSKSKRENYFKYTVAYRE